MKSRVLSALLAILLATIACVVAWQTLSNEGTNNALPTPESFPIEWIRGELGTNHVRLVVFGAVWCPTCVKSVQLAEDLYRAARERDVDFLVVALDRGDALREHLREHPSDRSFPLVAGTARLHAAYRRAVDTFDLPHAFLLDGEGPLRLRWHGSPEEAARLLEGPLP